MAAQLPQLYVARHGETPWSAAGRHTGRTDVPLTLQGEQAARRLGERLAGKAFTGVFTSPLQRASRTCALAGFGETAAVDEDAVEWDYGRYEGKTTLEIVTSRPGWEIFRDGCPEGESVAAAAARANRVVERLRRLDGDALVFSHGHFLRLLAACWLGLDPAAGRCFYLDTAALSILGYAHGRDDPVIRLWNEAHPIRG
ncbi:MAG: histidine phosphatase family protein [Betaproteobacteria bacterium]|nr:histidine phosphatase family protein [Betaproteobacteria bacterium]